MAVLTWAGESGEEVKGEVEGQEEDSFRSSARLLSARASRRQSSLSARTRRQTHQNTVYTMHCRPDDPLSSATARVRSSAVASLSSTAACLVHYDSPWSSAMHR